MSLLAWIILGLVSGFIASKLINRTGEGVILDIVLGIVGAVIGGWLFNTFGMAGVTGLQPLQLAGGRRWCNRAAGCVPRSVPYCCLGQL